MLKKVLSVAVVSALCFMGWSCKSDDDDNGNSSLAKSIGKQWCDCYKAYYANEDEEKLEDCLDKINEADFQKVDKDANAKKEFLAAIEGCGSEDW